MKLGNSKYLGAIVITLGICSLLVVQPALAQSNMTQQINKLAEDLTSIKNGVVAKSTADKVYISLGQSHGIIPGNEFEIVRQGEELKVGDKVIGYEEENIAKVRVEQAREQMSVCRIVGKADPSKSPASGDKAYQLRKSIQRMVIAQPSFNQGFNRLTKHIQEKLFTAMLNRGMIMIERDQLEKVLAEQKLGYSGLVNIDSAKKIGQLLGAEGMVLGTVADMGNILTISTRLVDLETGNTISAAEIELPKTTQYAGMLSNQIEETFVVTTSSGKRKKAQSVVTRGSKMAFQNKFLKVSLKTVHRFGEDGKTINLSLWLENITKDDMYLTLYENKSEVFLLDDYGAEWFRAKPAVGITTDNHASKYCKSHKKLVMPGQSIPVSIVFQSTEATKGKQYTFNARFNGCIKGIKNLARFSVAIDGIRVP